MLELQALPPSQSLSSLNFTVYPPQETEYQILFSLQGNEHPDSKYFDDFFKNILSEWERNMNINFLSLGCW